MGCCIFIRESKMINLRRLTLIWVIIVLSNNAFGENPKDSSALQFKFDIEAQSFYQPTTLLGNKTDVFADVVSDRWGNAEKPTYKTVTDNPLIHGAFYARIKSETSYNKKYSLKLDLVVEDRGMSYGINDLNKIVVFPIYQFGFVDKYKFLNDSLRIALHVGSFINNKLHNGLKIYNVDTQGSDLTLEWRNFNFNLHEVGDLSFGIGLALADYTDVSLGYNVKLSKEKSLNFGINYNLNSYPPIDKILEIYKVPKYNNYGVFSKYTASKNANYYFQFELRNAPYINIKENGAFVIGSNLNYNFQKLSISFNPEIRYYGWMYNYGHKEDSITFRQKNNSGTFPNGVKYNNTYLNTVGRYLYPLMNFNNQFSQWAVYTDYQYQNIAGLELRTSIHWQFSEKLFAKMDVESCTLIKEHKTEDKKTFTYLFYTSSIVYQPVKYISIALEISNKMMNLDKYYQTFYMCKQPLIGISISKALSK